MTEAERKWVRKAIEANRKLGVAEGIIRAAEGATVSARGFTAMGQHNKGELLRDLARNLLSEGQDKLAAAQRVEQRLRIDEKLS